MLSNSIILEVLSYLFIEILNLVVNVISNLRAAFWSNFHFTNVDEINADLLSDVITG